MPIPVIKALGILKKSAAIVNVNFGLDQKIGNIVFDVSDGDSAGSPVGDRW